MQKTARTILFVFILAVVPSVFISLSSLAQETSPAHAASTSEQAQQAPQGKFIQDLGSQAINVMADKSLTQEQRSGKYRDLLREAFDLQTIGHFVLGRTWNTVTPGQQQEYMKLFESLVLKIYGDRLSFYSGESFRVKGVRQENDKDSIVNSEVLHSDGTSPTSIDWRVRSNGGKFAIVDVVIEGVSQSVTQRQEYASIIQRDGGKIDELLTLMRQQVEGNAAGKNNQQ